MLSPELRSLRARGAAYTKHAHGDSRDATAAARTAFLNRFIDEVDPDRMLPESERAPCRMRSQGILHTPRLPVRQEASAQKRESESERGNVNRLAHH